MPVSKGTYAIEGIPISSDVKFKTLKIPYASGMPVRKEIGKLFAPDDNVDLTKKQWTLFVYGLEAFKSMPVDEKLSYFQIAGIHGYPETAWDHAPDPPQDVKPNPITDKFHPGQDPFGGYCQHNMVTFPTWHRPYMLLFEKCIWTHMHKKIDQWVKDKVLSECEAVEWKTAADQWRLPYWDWARKQQYSDQFGLPLVFTLKWVPIHPPSGKVNHLNPLWGFVNPEKDENGEPRKFGDMPTKPVDKSKWNIKDDPAVADSELMPWSQCSGVSRYGVTRATPNKNKHKKYVYGGFEGINNFEMANGFLDDFSEQWYDMNVGYAKKGGQKPPGNLPDALNRMFSPDYNSTWGTFSTTKWYKEGAADISTGYMSLEYIHNNIHNIAGGMDFENGGVGQMADVPVAAFDPLFWMHHCMIDRLLSIWQVINWDLWWDKKESSDSRYPDPCPEDPLEPFHTNSEGGLWNSNMARDWTTLHYSYDDLAPNSDALDEHGHLKEQQYIDDMKQYIQDTYPCTADYVQSVYSNITVDNPTFFGPGNADDGVWNDYLINIIYDRYALKGRSYALEFWLGGDRNDRKSTLTFEENKIGQVYSLGGLTPRSDAETGCKNCGSQRDNKILSRAQVPITVPLMAQALSKDYKFIHTTLNKDVEKYLKEHLHWQFVEIGGAVRKAEEFVDTKISVLFGTGRTHKHIQEDERKHPPKYGSYEIMYNITADKECGVKENDKSLGVGKTNFRKLD